METKKEYLLRILNEARMRGLCKTQKEFAELLGMNASSISNALSGDERYLTDSIIRRVKAWEFQVLGADRVQRQQADPSRPDITIPAATLDLYTAMAKSIDRLTALVERMQPGAAAGYGYTQKNFRTEREG